MGLGLQGAYGLQGAQGALRQRLIDRMAMEQQQQQMEMQRAHLALQTRQMQGQEEDRRTDNARQASAEARILQGAEDTGVEKRFAMTPVDAQMPPSLALKSRALGLPITATPGQPVQQLQGFSTLPGDPQDASAPPMQQQLRVRSLPADPLAVPDRFTRGATQADTEKTLADTRATTAQSELGRHNVAMETAAGVTAKRGDAAQQESARHNRAMEANGNPFAFLTGGGGQAAAGGPKGAATGTSGPTGDEFLKQLPPNVASEVKAYAEGRRPFPTGMSYAKLQPLIQLVGQYDPTFDASNYNARNKARLDLTSPSGTGGKTVNALNTALQHAGKLSDLIEQLDNYEYPLANAVVNPLKTATGHTGVTNFKAVAPQLMKEIERAWRGTGGSTADIQQLIDSLGSNLGRQQQREALTNFMDLVKGKLDSTQQQRDNVMGPAAGASIPILFEQNKAVMDRINQRSGHGPTAPSAAENDPLGIR